MTKQIHPLVIVITTVSFLWTIIQGMQYINMDQKDYIRIEDDVMFIDRGVPILPKKKLTISSIERNIEYYPLLIFKLNRDRETQINIDWLNEKAVEAIKKYLDHKLGAYETNDYKN